jgi:hypothetical protein
MLSGRSSSPPGLEHSRTSVKKLWSLLHAQDTWAWDPAVHQRLPGTCVMALPQICHPWRSASNWQGVAIHKEGFYRSGVTVSPLSASGPHLCLSQQSSCGVTHVPKRLWPSMW